MDSQPPIVQPSPVKSKAKRNVKAGIFIIILLAVFSIIAYSFWIPGLANDNRHISKPASEIVLSLDQMPQGWTGHSSESMMGSGFLGDNNFTDAYGSMFTYSSSISGHASLASFIFIYNSTADANNVYKSYFDERPAADTMFNGSVGVGFQSMLTYRPEMDQGSLHFYKTIIFTYGNVLGMVGVYGDSQFKMSDQDLAALAKKMVDNMN